MHESAILCCRCPGLLVTIPEINDQDQFNQMIQQQQPQQLAQQPQMQLQHPPAGGVASSSANQPQSRQKPLLPGKEKAGSSSRQLQMQAPVAVPRWLLKSHHPVTLLSPAAQAGSKRTRTHDPTPTKMPVRICPQILGDTSISFDQVSSFSVGTMPSSIPSIYLAVESMLSLGGVR